MTITLGSTLVHHAKLHAPWQERWILEVHFDGPPPSGLVAVQWGNARFSGTVLPTKSGEVVTTGVATIIGGFGWQSKPPASWLIDTVAAPARVASQVAQLIGETLVIGADSMRQGRSAYARANDYASNILRDLLAKDALWWMDFDGTTQAATDRPASTCTAEVLHYEPAARRVKLDIEDPSQALVGATIPAKGERFPEAQRIRQVDIVADENGIECWAMLDPAIARSRVANLIEQIAMGAPPNPHATLRAATVQSQESDGRVSLRLEERDKELADPKPTSVWYGVPGVSADFFFGTRTLLGFDRANPDNPFAALFSPLGQTGHVPKKVRHEANEEIRMVGASAGVVRVGAVPTFALAREVDVSALLTALQSAAATMSASPIPEVVAVGGILSTALSSVTITGTTKLEAQ